MGNYSRDSFQDTKNALAELLGLVPSGLPGVRNYVSVRLQQAVPVVDADFNEEGDIRRMELEFLLAHAIGNGVPAASDGFRISANGLPNNFVISAGVLFNQGWLVYNRANVNYDSQPYQNANGAAPPWTALQPPAQPTTALVYLDAWETEVSSQQDGNLMDNRIGVETCVRLERAWLVRVAALAANADPRDPASIPTQQPGHRYYPLATIKRPASSQIGDSMIADLRRTQLSLDALTHAPLQIYDPVRDQHLDGTRLALAFQGNLDALAGILKLTPEVFVYTNHPVETAQALSALADVRASATSFHQQAQAGVLYQEAATAAMNTFFAIETLLLQTITQFSTAGLAVGFTATFLGVYNTDLNGSSVTDPTSLNFALQSGDLLGAVMAQERLSQDLGQQSNTLPQGTVALSLISVTPTTAVVASTVYQLTIRVESFLTSAGGSEQIQVIASAGAGWTIAFQGSVQTQMLVTVANGQTQDVVLSITAAPAAANTTLSLTARPQRRQQIVYQNPPAPLAIGQPVLAGSGPIVTLAYGGPTLQPGNLASVPRAVMFGGVPISFTVASLSTNTETYQITVTPQGVATGWQPPAQPVMAPLGPSQSRNVSVTFKTTDQAGASTPVTYQIQLVRVTGGVNDPQTNTNFNLTFQLT